MEVSLGIGLEALFALRIAEVVGLPLIFILPCGLCRIDSHAADRVSNTGRDSGARRLCRAERDQSASRRLLHGRLVPRLKIFFRIGLKFRRASLAAEVVILTAVLKASRRLFGIDRHPADGIFGACATL